MEHTPTPWYEANTGNHQGLVIAENTGENVAVTYDKANAEFIVQCCNAHNKLVNALRRIANGEVSTITESELATDTLRAVGESTEPYLYPTKGIKP